MTVLRLIIGIVLGVLGLCLIGYNTNNDTKHNVLIGSIGYTMVIAGAGLLGSCL